MTYEVAIVDNEEERTVLGRNIPSSELWACVASAFEEPPRGPRARMPAVLVSRMDALPSTWADRRDTLIDVATGTNKDGKAYTRRSVRYGKMRMKDWDLLMKLNAWRPKAPGKVQRIDGWQDSTMCRNGDPLCACLVLNTTCRTQSRGQKVLASSIKEA